MTALTCYTAALFLIIISWDSDMDRKDIFLQYKSRAARSLKTINAKRKSDSVYVMMTHVYQEKINSLRDKYDLYFYFTGRDKQHSQFIFYSICRLHEKRKSLNCHTMRFS